MNLPAFIDRWLKSGSSERANKDSFLKKRLTLTASVNKRCSPSSHLAICTHPFQGHPRSHEGRGKNEPLTEKDRVIHQQGLVSVLEQLHDDLDRAVFDAYGWPHDLTDEQILEKLVALNAERAEEEPNGHVRWRRPEFQNPSGARKPENLTLAGIGVLAAYGETEKELRRGVPTRASGA